MTLSVPKASGGQEINVKPIANPSPWTAPEGVDFPYGFFRFTVTGIGPGGSTTVTIQLPQDGPIPTTYWKYGPLPPPPPGGSVWYEFLYPHASGTGAEIQAAERRIILHLTDGQRGDSDLSANGIILDPGAPAVTEAPRAPATWMKTEPWTPRTLPFLPEILEKRAALRAAIRTLSRTAIWTEWTFTGSWTILEGPTARSTILKNLTNRVGFIRPAGKTLPRDRPGKARSPEYFAPVAAPCPPLAARI